MKTNVFFKRFTSVFLVLAMMVALMPTIFAQTTQTLTSPYKLEADSVTFDSWKNVFGSNYFDTVNAGGVWTDKSVFTSASVLGSLVGIDGKPLSVSNGANNFLVTLSTIAANKSIVGYSHVPTDTVLVLDVSGSMYNSSSVSDLVTATNAAITSLQALNEHNRVGIVVYSATSQTLLELDRYETSKTQTYDNGTRNDTSDDKTINVYLEANSSGNKISINSSVKNGNEESVGGNTVTVTGGTYTQAGIDAAMDMFLAVPKSDTVITGSNFQSGTERKPVIVLMADGDATYAASNYANVPNRYNIGDGSTSTNNNRFLAQLTAAQAKARISEHYNDTETLFYTLGLGSTSAILDPNTSSNSLKNLWNSFTALDDDEYLSVSNRPVRPSSYITSVDDMYYVTDAFEAESRADLYTTFEKIVNQIIIQSLYSPTNVSTTTDFDGFVTFTDILGKYMEVKDVKGILLGNTLFSGSHFAEVAMNGTGSLGTPESPTDLGNDFVMAVIQRMGLDKLTSRFPTHESRVAEARSLINLAYTHGQISYNSSTGEFNNFIGWYADENGEYIGFWDPEHTAEQRPDNAVYTNKCYGMLGEVKDGYRESDMLYITIQIHTNIDTQEQTVVFKIPSSLIPVVSYNVTLEGASLENATNISVEIDSAEPIRLLYEVGLRSDINSLNVSSKVDASNRNSNGTYTFYTNAYDAKVIKDSEDAEARGDESHVGEPGNNTFANFQPSTENERYYYNVNTAIYELSGTSYVPYDAETHPKNVSTKLYRAYTHFKSTDGVSWELYTDYAAINHDTLVSAARYTSGTEEGHWYVPAGTIHHNLDSTEVKKASNSVNDVEYSHYQFIHENAAHDSTYHIDTILGNNGRLTVTPSTALSVSKKIDDTITDLDAEYSFTVSSESANAQFTLVIEDEKSNMISYPTTFDANGKFTFGIKAGTTAYLSGISAGSYSVTENVDGEDNYHVKSIAVNGTEVSGENISVANEITVTDKTVTDVEFLNTLGTGTPLESYLIITKTVTHDFGDDYTVSTDKTFPISIDLGDDYAGDTLEIHTTKQTAAISKTADANGVIIYDIAHNEHITLSVKVGTEVNVTEDLGNSYPGFNTPSITYTNGDLTGNAAKIVADGNNLTINIVNDYDAEAVDSVNIEVNATKVLEGRDWLDSDEFTFELQRYSPHDASYETVGTLTATKNSKTLDFSSIIQGYSFDSLGQYHFRVIEVIDGTAIGGVTYDLVGRYFNVVVSDDLSGELIISDVQATSLTSVTLDNGTYKVTANNVVNTYAPSGDDEVFVTIDKSVAIKDAPAGVTGTFSLSGFKFGLYDKDGAELVINDPFVTDNNGNTLIKLMFSASDAGEEFYYTVKEMITAGDTTYEYDTTKYKLKIAVVDDLDGTVSAVLSIYDNDEADYVEVPGGNSATVSFVNKYVIPGTVSETLNIQKIMQNLGTKKYGLNGFEFELRDDARNPIDTFVSDDDGKASFTLEYDVTDIGKTYTYTLAEKDGGVANMDYSDELYTIKAKVTLTSNNELSLEVSVTNKQLSNVTGDLEFTNIYDEDLAPQGSDSVTIAIDKRITIKNAPAGVTGNLSPEGFKFILADAQGNEIGTYTVDANGKATVTLTFTADDHVGNTYYYILKEIIPDNNLYEYDTTEYKLKVEVIDNHDGTISAKLSVYDGSAQSYIQMTNDSYTAEFENKFIISENAIEKLNILKEMKNLGTLTLEPKGFKFILKDENNITVGTFETDEDGEAEISFTYGLADVGRTFTFTLEEVDTGLENVTYDDEIYTIVVKVVLDDDNKVDLEFEITTSEETPVNGDTMTFVNSYDEDIPATGDSTLLIGAGIVLLAIVGGAVVFTRKRRLA